MKVVFRVDASSQIGSGHLVRCLTLADEIVRRGAQCIFICRAHSGHMIDTVRDRGYDVEMLANPGANQAEDTNKYLEGENYEQLLGVHWEEDARDTSDLLRNLDADWLIVDHYAIDSKWEMALSPFFKKLLVVDDIANRPHVADVLVDQNYVDKSRYLGLVPQDSILLLGPEFALLRTEYAEYRRLRCVSRVSLERVFIYFGGNDSSDLTGKAVEALSSPDLADLEVDVVVSANYQFLDRLQDAARLRGRIKLHKPRLHLADLMSGADLAIGAGGVTNWERMCIGLPSLVVTLADNQIPISKLLDELGVIRLVGDSGSMDVETLRHALRVEKRTGLLAGGKAKMLELCDGKGVQRVADVLMPVG